jgi:hypothetical protein
VSDLFRAFSGPNDSSETIGRTHERHDQRSHSYQHLQAAQAAQQAAQRSKIGRLAKRIAKKGDKS